MLERFFSKLTHDTLVHAEQIQLAYLHCLPPSAEFKPLKATGSVVVVTAGRHGEARTVRQYENPINLKIETARVSSEYDFLDSWKHCVTTRLMS